MTTAIANSAGIANSAARPTTSDGFIIVAVLWILGALAALVSIYAVFVLDTAAAFSVHDDRFRAEALVSAAVELTAYRLTAPPELRPTQGQFNFRMGEANVAVDFRSEAARIDLNAAPKELLINLFEVLGWRRDSAENYADRIVAWRTAPPDGQDPEIAAYQMAGLRYAPRGARFPHVNELALVLNLPISFVEQTLPFLTVYSGRPQVNVFDAAPQVIAALPGMTRDRLNAVLAQRQATPRNAQILMSLLGPAQGFVTTEGSKASRIRVHIAFDNSRQLDAEVVILMFEEGNEPFSVLSWRGELNE